MERTMSTAGTATIRILAQPRREAGLKGMPNRTVKFSGFSSTQAGMVMSAWVHPSAGPRQERATAAAPTMAP